MAENFFGIADSFSPLAQNIVGCYPKFGQRLADFAEFCPKIVGKYCRGVMVIANFVRETATLSECNLATPIRHSRNEKRFPEVECTPGFPQTKVSAYMPSRRFSGGFCRL
jgi:hypothetical protein